MSRVDIVHLETYRERRHSRYRRARALYASDREGGKVLEHLWNALSLTGADRGAVVWLDEYGAGQVHPHAVLDLGADPPRRAFSARLLRTPWQTRVPDILDLSQGEMLGDPKPETMASVCALAMGSDGPRSWFLVLDSLTPRPALADRTRESLMFLAGEVASVVLHRDLPTGRGVGTGGNDGRSAGSKRRSGAFPGWPVLQDLDGEGRDGVMAERIRCRFLVARLVRSLLDENLVMEPDSLNGQIEGVRKEIGSGLWPSEEGEAWDRTLRAAHVQDFPSLAAEVLGWGRIVESQGHWNGALELLEMAFEVAKATAGSEIGLEAARALGKAYRTRADWEPAMKWYDVARTIAEGGVEKKLAVVLDGMANAYRDRGNLPKARDLLQEVLSLGSRTSDGYALAIGHHDLMTVEKLGGNLTLAIQHGWEAVRCYGPGQGSLNALFDLGGVLREGGELAAARDAYTVVAHQAEGFEYRVLALDALSFIAALQGDVGTFRRHSRTMEEEGWRRLDPVYKGQVLFYKGLASRALGMEAKSLAWLEEALGYAEKHGLNKLIFDIEEALRETAPEEGNEIRPETRETSGNEELSTIRQGLRELRESLVGVG